MVFLSLPENHPTHNGLVQRGPIRAIEVQSSVGGAAFQPAGIFTDPREVTVTGLTPGTVYTFHVRVYGSHNQKSDWCDPVSHMAM